MDEQLHDIDRLFKKAVAQHSELPSSKVWENLERSLQKRNVTSINRKYKKWRWVAAALFIFSLALAMYTFRLNLKYKKAIEKIPANAERDNRKTVGGSTGFLPGPRDKKTNKNVQSGENTNQKAIIGGIAVTQSSFNTKKKINVADNTANTNTSSTTDNEAANVNQKTSQNTKPVKATVATITAKRAFEQNNSKSENRTVLQKKCTSGIRTNGVKIFGQKVFDDIPYTTTTPNTVTSTAKQEVQTETADRITATTVNKNTDLSTGLAEIPISILNGKLPVMPFSVNDTRDASTLKVNNKRQAAPFSVSINRRRFTASIYYSRDFVSAGIKENNPDFREDNHLQIKSHEKNRAANVVGLSVVRNIGRKFGVETGISLHTFITDINAKSLVARKDNNGKVNYRISSSSGYAYYSIKNRPNPPLADSIKTLSSRSKVKYVGVPIGLRYHFYAGKRLSFNPAAIFSANFLSSGNITTIQSLEHTYSNNIEGLKPHYFDVAFTMSISYYLNKRIGISLIPSTSFALSDATQTKPVTMRRNTAGVAAGLNFSF